MFALSVLWAALIIRLTVVVVVFLGGSFFVLFLFCFIRTTTVIRQIVVEICASVLMPPAVRPSCNYQNVDLHWM